MQIGNLSEKCLHNIIFTSSSFKLHISLYLRCTSWMLHVIDSVCLFTGGWLLYTIVLVSAIHQPKSATGIHMFPPSWIPLPSPSRLSQSTGLSSLCHTASSHLLFYIWKCIRFHAILSICPTLSLPHYVHKSVLYTYVWMAALRIELSVPSFQIPYAYVNIQYLFFSDLLRPV